MTSRPPKRPRAARRETARALEKLGQSLDRATAALPGGLPDNPLPVFTGAAALDKARAQHCARCDGNVDVAAEAVEFRGSTQLRRFEIVCRRCHVRRVVWISIAPNDQRRVTTNLD